MAAVKTPAPSEHGQREHDAVSLLEVENGPSSHPRVEEMSNASLYCMTPPAYALSAAEDEITVDAESMQGEKAGIPDIPNPPYTPRPSHASKVWERDTYQVQPLRPTSENGEPYMSGGAPASINGTIPEDQPPVYYQEVTQDAAIASVKRCTVFPSRPAVWQVKRTDYALSPLAATVLVKEGILRSKDLELISTTAGIKREPNDPLSGLAFATYDTLSDILIGLIEGPMEATKQVTPMLLKHEHQRGAEPPTVRYSVLQETAPLSRTPTTVSDATITHRQQESTWTPPRSETSESWEPRVWSDAEKKNAPRSSTLEAAPNAAKEVVMSTGKGIGRMLGAGLKAPMTFTHGLTRGFHNLPKMYGDDVREYEEVTDFRSGLQVSAKSLGHGFGDGLRDFFVQPVIGAQKEGAKGFAKGFGKGVGNLVCKPSAGIAGVFGYSTVGVYKQLQWMKPPGKHDTIELFKAHGEKEYSQAPEEARTEVVGKWCQITMGESSSDKAEARL